MTDATDPRGLAVEKFAGASGTGMARAIDWLGAHATDAPLAVRALLGAVSAAVRPGSRVCELGFGSGWLLEEMRREWPACRLYGLDRPEAIVLDAQVLFSSQVRVIRGDMERLPIRDGVFDAVVTCWTLYFMGDIADALQAFRRCLKPGGRFVTATVAPDHMLEFEELRAAAIRAALGREPEADAGLRFDLQSGAPYIAQAFVYSEMREWHGEIALPDVQTALELWEIYGKHEVSEEEAEAARLEYARIVEARIKRDGTINVRRHDGLFIGADAPIQ